MSEATTGANGYGCRAQSDAAMILQAFLFGWTSLCVLVRFLRSGAGSLLAELRSTTERNSLDRILDADRGARPNANSAAAYDRISS